MEPPCWNLQAFTAFVLMSLCTDLRHSSLLHSGKKDVRISSRTAAGEAQKLSAAVSHQPQAVDPKPLKMIPFASSASLTTSQPLPVKMGPKSSHDHSFKLQTMQLTQHDPDLFVKIREKRASVACTNCRASKKKVITKIPPRCHGDRTCSFPQCKQEGDQGDCKTCLARNKTCVYLPCSSQPSPSQLSPINAQAVPSPSPSPSPSVSHTFYLPLQYFCLFCLFHCRPSQVRLQRCQSPQWVSLYLLRMPHGWNVQHQGE